MIYQSRNRTKIKYIVHAIQIFFDGLSLKDTSKAFQGLLNKSYINKRLHSKIWTEEIVIRCKEEWIIHNRGALMKVGFECVWLWDIIEPKDNEILSITISKERLCLWQWSFYKRLEKNYNSYPVSAD